MSGKSSPEAPSQAHCDAESPRRGLAAVLSPFRPANSKLQVPERHAGLPARAVAQPEPGRGAHPESDASGSDDVRIHVVRRAVQSYRAARTSSPGRVVTGHASVSLAPSSEQGDGSRSPVKPQARDLSLLRHSTRLNAEASALHEGSRSGVSPRRTQQRSLSPPAAVRASLVVDRPLSETSEATAVSYTGRRLPTSPHIPSLPGGGAGGGTRGGALPLVGSVSPDAAERGSRMEAELETLRRENAELRERLRTTEASLGAMVAELDDAKHQLFVVGARQEQSAATIVDLTKAFEEVKELSARRLEDEQVARAQVAEERDAAVEEILRMEAEVDRLRRAIRELAATC